MFLIGLNNYFIFLLNKKEPEYIIDLNDKICWSEDQKKLLLCKVNLVYRVLSVMVSCMN